MVHNQHGIGKYLGVKTMEIEGIRRDYLRIQYGGDDQLYVPTDQVGMLQNISAQRGRSLVFTRWAALSGPKPRPKPRQQPKT